MKPEASAATKAADKQLAKVQTLLLDSLAPITSLLENHHRGTKGSDPGSAVNCGAHWQCQGQYVTPPEEEDY